MKKISKQAYIADTAIIYDAVEIGEDVMIHLLHPILLPAYNTTPGHKIEFSPIISFENSTLIFLDVTPGDVGNFPNTQ